MLGEKSIQPGLRREIAVVLCIKLLLLIVLKLTFFNAPPPTGSVEQARHLIGVDPSPSPSSAKGASS